MRISIVNLTDGAISDEEVQTVIRAVNRQIAADLYPYWSLSATLRLDSAGDGAADGIIYLRDRAKVEEALGHHERAHPTVPCGFVFTAASERLGESWTVTLSHEVLGLIGDPELRLLVAGPHPSDRGRLVFYWHEIADAVQFDVYLVDGVEVSNFVLPSYFRRDDGGRRDFLGCVRRGGALAPFGARPGGCVGFFDPERGTSNTFSRRGDSAALRRLEVRRRLGPTQRAIRRRIVTPPADAAVDLDAHREPLVAIEAD
jgi:hypothetical protein